MIPQSALDFIDNLSQNNNRDWFLNHKKEYEVFKKNYQELIITLLEKLKPLDPKLEILEVKNCTFRINRDIRFSKDKSPYKTNMAIWFSTNRNNKNSPGYYLHYEKNNSFIAGGVWCPEPEELKKIRKEIEFFHDDLEIILNNHEFKEEFKTLDFDPKNSLKNPPKGIDATHPAIEILKLKTFVTVQKINDNLFTEEDFSNTIVKKLIVLKPLNDFLSRALEA